eukprot:jgi/Tetstr1/441235/TSEL_029491.t1
MDRSVPLWSEDGVQHGAPLATTSFGVAIHPEVHECDNTLEVKDGAARFNADDRYIRWASRSTFGRPFTPSVLASVGLEVRLDQMHAYIADMEARREAPADID